MMFFATLLLAEPVLAPAAGDARNEVYSRDTEQKYLAYGQCLAQKTYSMRDQNGSPEEHVRLAKNECRREYDSFVTAAVDDHDNQTDAAEAAVRARDILNEMDERVAVGPTPPPALAQLPVESMIGHWRLGKGPMSQYMEVAFEHNGSVAGVLNPVTPLQIIGLKKWSITGNGTKRAVFHADFASGASADYSSIPSQPSELNFINPLESDVQRFDILIHEYNLILKWVGADGNGGQLRFHRNIGDQSAD